MNTLPLLLGMSGSLRRGSFSTAILATIAARVAHWVTLEAFPLDAIPLYNQDIDIDEPPPAVAALRDAIGKADGLVIVSPEYNYGISGVLKNALDWASRPYGRSALPQKPVVTLTSSPAFTGGVRAQAQLDQTLRAIGARVLLRAEIVIGNVHEKVLDMQLVDEPTLKVLDEAIRDMVTQIEAGKPSSK